MIVKVCGITNEADARAAIELGATALGFNFWPGSPRFLSVGAAAAFVPQLTGAEKVGLFVDAPPEKVAAVAARLGLDVVQLHGSAIAPNGLRQWRAMPVNDGFNLASLNDPAAEAYLLDAPAGAQHGGTGRTFDWNLIRETGRRIVLAGGLDGGNVARAIAAVRPWGVDACSRLESAPGRKDRARMESFITAALSTCT